MVGDRSVTVTLKAEIALYQARLKQAAAETAGFAKSVDSTRGPLTGMEKDSKRAGNEIDKLSGRLRLAADAALILGPALAPLGAAAVGGVVALSAQLGALAGGLGVTVLAMKGLGDGLTALDKYQLDPTAENLKKLNNEMGKLGPAGEDFVRFLDSIEPNLKTLQNAAREGLLPGAQEGIESLMQRLPELRKLIRGLATEMGDLFSDAGGAIGGPRFDAFFKYLRTDGVKILDDTGRAIGNLTETVANLFVAFGGVSTDFSGGLLKFTEGLAEASANLDSSAGFQQFVDYIETEGPVALETLGSLANAFLQIVEAAAPLGGPVLKAVGQFADAIARIADSDLGTPIFAGLAALALLNRSLILTQKLTATTFGGPAVTAMKGYVSGLTTVVSAQERAQMSAAELDAANAKTSGNFAKGAGQVGLLGLALSGVADSTGLANTAMLAMLGPWGAAAGVVLDLKSAWDGLGDSIEANSAALESGSSAALVQRIADTKKQLEDLQSTSGTEAFGKAVGNSVGLGFLADAQDEMGAVSGKTADLNDQLADMQKRLAELQGASADGASGLSSMVAPLAGVREGMEKAAEAARAQQDAINGTVEAMRDERMEALRSANAELDYQQAIDDATAAVKKNGKTHDETTEKGRDNLRALHALAGAWNSQSEVIKDNAGKLREARQNFIDTAESMGMTREAAKKLSRELFEIPTKRQIDITLDTHGATADLIALKARMDAIKSKTVSINVVGGPHAGGQTATDEQVPTKHHANGGTVPKTGMPYADRHSYMLADGEEVISNRYGQADRHRSLLKQINANRLADGGTAGDHTDKANDGHPHGVRHSTFILSEQGADIVKGAKGIAAALRMLQAALAKSEKAFDKERQARDDAASQLAAFSSSVGGAYSSLDPFAAATQTGSPWAAGGGVQDPLSIFDSAVAGNTATTTAAQTALGTAAGNGLDGPLYQALAQSGNLQLLQAFAGLSAADIQQREDKFAAQTSAQSALGASAAAQAGFTAALAGSEERLDSIRDEVRELRKDVRTADKNNKAAQEKNAKDVKDGVNGAAGNGHRRGR